MKQILITGGGGFIGTHLAEFHVAKGDFVCVLDNNANSLGKPIENERYCYISQFCENLNKIKLNADFDVVYHLASESRPAMFAERHREIISANVGGMTEILNRVSYRTKIIFASTSEIYGDNPKNLEDSYTMLQPGNPRAIYAYAKLLTESLLQNSKQFNWNIVRLFNVYGPDFREDDTKVIPSLIRAHKEKTPFTIYGDGEQVRCFTWYADVVDALVRISDSTCKHQTFNIGNTDEISINDLASIYFPEVEIKYEAERIGEPRWRKPDITKIREEIGWMPLVDLNVGLSRLDK